MSLIFKYIYVYFQHTGDIIQLYYKCVLIVATLSQSSTWILNQNIKILHSCIQNYIEVLYLSKCTGERYRSSHYAPESE